MDKNNERTTTSSSTIERVPYGSLDDSVIPTGRNSSSIRSSTTAVHHNHKHDDIQHVHHIGSNDQCDHTAEDAASASSRYDYDGGSSSNDGGEEITCWGGVTLQIPSLRKIALILSLYCNVAITLSKLVIYVQTYSLSVLAALLDSVLDVVSQVVLNYTEQHSSMQRSSAFYPAGASRLEPIGVLTCAALMGMASFEVLKESTIALFDKSLHDLKPQIAPVYNMIIILLVKLALLVLCRRGANKRRVKLDIPSDGEDIVQMMESTDEQKQLLSNGETIATEPPSMATSSATTILQPSKHVVQFADPTLEALAQDHWNDCLSNGVAAGALLCAVKAPHLWFLDPIGAILISMYIIYSWFTTGKEQIEHLTGKSAPEEFIQELVDLANEFDDRIAVDTVRAYHFGPKFLVEIEIVMDASTLLFESHDLGMDLQYEIEGREEVERCFVHIDYQARPYDEHVVSKVPELREKYFKQPSVKQMRSTQSI
jgi:cation diffusion facilitator family transporter